MYCFSIIEANTAASRSTGSASALASSAASGPASASASASSLSSLARPSLSARNTSQNLAIPREARRANIDLGFDDYFPFDPYGLPRSGEVVQGLYRTWAEVALDGDSDEEEEEDEDEDDEDEGEEESGTSYLSPGDRHVHVHGLGLGKRMAGTSASLDRRRALQEGGVLSSSFEGMSISPHLAGIA
jgi:RNA polymerase I-specific transcription initiation factor RRN3